MSASKPVGIRLNRKKEASLINWNLKRPLQPEKVCIPVPATAFPCVREREEIRPGQAIAVPAGPGCATVHASMFGIVEQIAPMMNAFGNECMMIKIRRYGEPKAAPAFSDFRKNWESIPGEELLEIFQNSGLVTTDPSMQPVHAKIKAKSSAQTILINGCEPEPYITCEQVLTLSHPLEILKGADLLKKAAGAVKILFVLEDCNSELIELIKSKIYFLKWNHVEVRTVPAIYPQGLESLLIQNWFLGKEDQAVVFPTSAAFAAYEAVVHQKPFYERVVTVGGECVVEPRSLWLPLGVSLHEAFMACKGLMREPGRVIMGGPMAGTSQVSLEVPVEAGTSAILALPKETVSEATGGPCIRCNLCVDLCPVSISPAMITLASEQKEIEITEEWSVPECIECGNCGYVCPSKRPMLELIRVARHRLKKQMLREKTMVSR